MSNDKKKQTIEIGFKSGSVVQIEVTEWSITWDAWEGAFTGYSFTGNDPDRAFSCTPGQIEYWRRVK